MMASPLYQILVLHREKHVAHALRIFFAGEFDDKQIGQGWNLHALK